MKKASEINVAELDQEVGYFDCAAARAGIIGDVFGIGTGGILWIAGAGMELLGSGMRSLGGELVNAGIEDYRENTNTLKKYEKQKIRKKIDKKEDEIAVLKAGLRMI